MKLKKSSLEAVESEAKQGDGAYIAQRFREPSLDDLQASSGSTTGEKVGAIVALITLAILAGICVMQYLDIEVFQ
ncbi:MAG: hypothetical protein IJR99_12035 [Kiritimatiellae bacterium]|nr:hypothetical protein [Kiritimatiellia bacterium]